MAEAEPQKPAEAGLIVSGACDPRRERLGYGKWLFKAALLENAFACVEEEPSITGTKKLFIYLWQ